MKILMISSECVPFAKTGGLADVVGALPATLNRRGHETIVVMPKYASIDYARHGLNPFLNSMGVWMGDRQEWVSVHMSSKYGAPVYFIEFHAYFDRSGLYHDPNNNDYQDNPRRFGLLTRAALQLCKDIGFKPDIVHAHDWQAALAPAYLKLWDWNDPTLGSAASVLTIHNLAYQGVYNARDYEYLGLQWGNFTANKFEDHGNINFLKGGIHYADMLNTVSPSFARETRSAEHGFGLSPYLNARGSDYQGILNGVDYTRWSPDIDRLIPACYSLNDLSGKAVCKRELQRRMQLDQDPGVPLIGVISRLASQKGLDLLAQVIESLVRSMRVQFAILGSGDKSLESYYGSLPARFPGRIGSFIGFDEELSHWIEAGADDFLMPSIYEPCGLNQIYSLKYGTLPIVRATGGLDDTIQQYDEASGSGTGFKFWEASPAAVYYTIGWAVSTYFDRPAHQLNMLRLAMRQNFSWDESARQYELLYEQALANRRMHSG
ncbi:MAG: glycogen synthase GlgA [Chloroflexota bacterium]